MQQQYQIACRARPRVHSSARLPQAYLLGCNSPSIRYPLTTPMPPSQQVELGMQATGAELVSMASIEG